ncbi:MAG: glycosyltransferase, partial [Alphaproteobacteria bacterium]|nr:glycosyltransferase [Alphaproteobacteria bacterium]
LDDRIRCLRRVGRRGLSSACIEGMLSTAAKYIAVIDADLQHDETLLPEMLRRLKAGDVDLAIASRYVGSGSADAFSARRARLSRSGARLAQLLIRTPVADPVSGFFMLRRAVLDEAVPRLSGVGMKILIDIMASAPGPLSVVELPYRFRPRRRGESKLDVLTAVEYLLLLAEKLTPRAISHKLLLFLCVGATGIVVHVSVLRLMLATVGSSFTEAQGIATATAMVWNFFINNLLTYRDVRLTGWRAVTGLFSFMAVCSLGMIVNLAVARDLYAWTGMWLAAGVGGAAVGALLNYALASIFTWGRRI